MGTTVQWWLAELDQYGNPTLCDGAHSARAGADRAYYLYGALGLGEGKRYAVARVALSEPVANAEGADQEAIRTLNDMGLRPSPLATNTTGGA